MPLQSYRGALITREGLRALDDKILRHSNNLRDSIATNGDRNARGTGCSAARNMVDEVTRQHNTTRTLLEDVRRLRDEATVVDDPVSCEVLGIGHMGHFSFHTITEDGSITATEKKLIHVVGFNEGDCDSIPQRLSYQAPLVASFVGRAVGWSEEVKLRGVDYEMVLDEIKLPNSL